MAKKDFSLLVIKSPPFFIEGKTSDIFQTYPKNIILEVNKIINKKLTF